MSVSITDPCKRPDGMSQAEWQSRFECAAGHHLLELYGLTDMVEGVLALRVADEADAYLLKTYRTFFDEVRASDLVKLRFDETPDAGPGRPLNYASCAQARGVLAARGDVNCVLHTHVPASTVVASLETGLEPVIQHALIVLGQIVYVPCDIGNDTDAVTDIVAAMGQRKIAMIRNHGILIAGKNVAETLFLAITLEYACQCQLSAQQSGRRVLSFPVADAERLALEFTSDPNNEYAFDGTLQWEGWLRKLDRLGACYRD
ncbi:MAG: class II aldolase/adducin family protein [Gammaproteobacteria bacterium]|nr:class II aldolase/adducin family protein [Gammaproteobacteria bacterium]